jgi:protoheme IX farnesyltransferase
VTTRTATWREDVFELAKVRIVGLSVAMAAMGYFLASVGEPSRPWRFVALMAGLSFLGAGCGAWNHVLERDVDARMRRTAHRPIPAGRWSWQAAAWFGTAATALGLLFLFLGVNALTGWLGFATFVSYVVVYTPLKRYSSLATLVGAVPGALPPLIGWTGATGRVGLEGMLLFGILFLWQIPHFLALAWLYREDYARAGFPVLTVLDTGGAQTARQAVLYAAVLVPLSVIPTIAGLAGAVYFAGALLLGLGFFACAVALWRKRETKQARRLFFASLVYLPALALLLCWDRWL